MSEQWAVIEVMGHQKHAGRVREGTIAGVPVLVVEQPAFSRTMKDTEGWPSRRTRTATYSYPARTIELGGGSIFRRILCTEEEARSMLPYCTQVLDTEVVYGEWEAPAERPQLAGPVEEAEEVVEDGIPFDDVVEE